MLSLLGQMGVEVSLDDEARGRADGGEPAQPRGALRAGQNHACVHPGAGAAAGAFRRGARVACPGGCAIGSRPVDLHIKGLQAMGAQIDIEHGYIHGRADRLKGARIVMDLVTVTGTENLMMAATLAAGHHGHRERRARARGRRSGELPERDGCSRVRARHRRHHHRRRRAFAWRRPIAVMPDRIETGTFLIAAAATGGDVRLKDTRPDMLDAVLAKLREAGVHVEQGTGLARGEEQRGTQGRERAHRALSGVPDRHAGAVHGPEHGCRRHGA